MKELLTIQQELNAPKNLRNNFWNYNYRSAETILEALKPLLQKVECTLKLSDELVCIWERYYIKAIAELKDSDWKVVETACWYAREEEIKKGMDWSQITGASSSYARKYALNWLFAIDDWQDSDATNTQQKWKLDVKDYVTRIKDEQDINHLDTIYKEFVAQKPSEKQLEWFIREAKTRKEQLQG